MTCIDRGTVSFLAIVVAGLAQPVAAQDGNPATATVPAAQGTTTPPPVAASSDPADARSPAATSRNGLEDIVVVARRTAEKLQDVPISVTAISANTLRAASITQSSDLIKLVPTLNVQQSSTSPDSQFSLRGIRTGVITYFNEVPTTTSAVNDQLWDVSSVQALAGPQGTLFGRNSTGGAILFVPQKPTDKFEGYVEGGYGNYNWRRGTAVVNVPVAPYLKIRLGARLDRRDGVVGNLIGQRLQSQHLDSYRASMLFDPGDVISNYTVFDYSKRHETPPALISSDISPTLGCFAGLGCIFGDTPAALGALQDKIGIREVSSSFPEELDSKEYGVSNILQVQPVEGLTFKYIFGYRHSSYDRLTSQSHLDLPIEIGENTKDGHQMTNEFQVLGKVLDNRLNWVVGAFFLRDRTFGSTSYELFGNPALPFSNDRNIYTPEQDRRNTTGYYAQATLTVLPRLNVTGGIRFNSDRIGLHVHSVGPQFTFFGPQTCRLPDAPGVDLVNCERDLSAHFKATTYNASIDYHLTRDTLIYFTTRHGFNGGGFNSSVPQPQNAAAPQPAYGPETITDYEGGVKAQWHLFGMPIRTNLSGYVAKYDNIQRQTFGISSAGAPYLGISNGPKATIYGFQIESTLKVTNGLLLNANYGYLHTQYDEGSPGFPKGNSFAQAPKSTLNLSANYTHDLAWGGALDATAGFTYQSKVSFADSNLNSPITFQKGYGIVDARLGWDRVAGTRFDVSVFVKNLTDKAYALERQDQTALFGYISTIYNDPRTFGVEVRYSF